MLSRHNFTVQTTRQKRLAHDDNAVAYFFCHVAFQPEVPSHYLSTNMSSAQLRLYLRPEDRSRFIISTFRDFCRKTRFQHKWRPTEHWTALMHLYYDIPKALQYDGNDLKEQLRKDLAMQIDIKRDHRLPNLHGIYHDRYKPGKQTINCYYACNLVKSMSMHLQQESGTTAFQAFQNLKRSVKQLRIQPVRNESSPVMSLTLSHE